MIKVLIADDEILELDYLRHLFEEIDGYQLVGMADNGAKAVELTTFYNPDVVILDINMPLSGLEAARLIREQFPDKIIILNTAYADFAYARKAVGLHLDGYLLKPASAEEILETVANCMQERKRTKAGKPEMVRPQFLDLYDLAEQMLEHLKGHKTELFTDSSAEFIYYLDQNNLWGEDCRLYLVNTVFRIGQMLKELNLPNMVIKLVNYDGTLAQMENCSGETLSYLIREFFRSVNIALQTGKRNDFDPLEAVRLYIGSHYTEEITLQQLSDVAHFSTGHLSRMFNQKFGVSIREYINRIRVEEALRKLSVGQKNITEIALDCGFKNISHFYRIFKKHTGTTPKAIGEKH